MMKIILTLILMTGLSKALAIDGSQDDIKGGMDHSGQNTSPITTIEKEIPDIGEGSAYDVEFKRIGKSLYQQIVDSGLEFKDLEYNPKLLLEAINSYTPKAVDESFGKDHDGRQGLCNRKEKIIRFRNEHWKNLNKYQKKLLVLHEYLNCHVVPERDTEYYYTDKTFDLLAQSNAENRQTPAPKKGKIKLIIVEVKPNRVFRGNVIDYIVKITNRPWVARLLSRCGQYSNKSVELTITKENGNQFVAITTEFNNYNKCANFHNYILTADTENPITLTFDRIKGLQIED